MEHGFEPEGSRNQALADMYANQIQDVLTEFHPWICTIFHKGSDDKIAEAWTDVALPIFKNKFANAFEKQLKENGTGFLVGTKLTWVDFLTTNIPALVQRYGRTPVLDEYPHLKKHLEMLYNDPKIAEAVKREQTYPL